MHTDSPFWLEIAFGLTTALTLALFYWASRRNKTVLLVSLLWLAIQGFLTMLGVYQVDSMPPRFLLLVAPPIVLILVLLLTAKGKAILHSFDLKALHWVHVVRVPVEICLLFLYLSNLIPVEMTFESRNLDILAGLTAPLVVLLYFHRKSISKRMLILWNVVCILLLVNVVAHAAFALPFWFENFGFEQANYAVLYSPYSWLPTFVVPVVFLSHFASIAQLRRSL